MKKNTSTHSGFLRARVLMAVAFVGGAAWLGMFSFASNPGTSTITIPTQANQTVTVTWSGMIPPGANGASDCTNLADTPLADQHLPTINEPPGVYNNVKAKFTFNIKWDNADNDEILTVINPDGSTLDSSDGGTPSETVVGNNLHGGTYKVVACGFLSAPDPQPYVGTLTIDTSSGPPPPPPTPTPAPAAPGVPRYLNYAAPPAVGENAGEPSIGYNLTSGKGMYIAGLQTLRINFPEDITPQGSVPEACPAVWEDVSHIVTKTKSLDPILFTDQRTGRTFVSQLDSVVLPTNRLVGLNSFMAYTDDDGLNWTPAQINPPDASYDHQTVGAGPYPAILPLGNPVNKGDAVYYCAQAGYTAFCSRSDDGGLNFGRATAIYAAVSSPAGPGCVGIHGHVKVAPDGTVYIPNFSCDGKQSLIRSDDAGTTWTVHQIPTSAPGQGILDPSVGIASDGTLYFSYIHSDGHPHVAVSHDKGVTWVNDRDIGISQNIGNGVFVEAVAGNPQRAAVGFVGTTQTGDHEAPDFNGTWYVFIAHTYDGGDHWTTVNATPNAPVQRETCIWNEGGANLCRNLLDFNEITLDEKGRVLYSYADGCVNECEAGGPNSYTSKATVARQSGGKGLLSQFDTEFQEPVAPRRACLSGRRDDQASYLKWTAPDNGGSDITQYKIFRSDAQHAETQIGFQIGSKTSFTDRSTDPAIATYTYRIVAVNSASGQATNGPSSNSINLSVGPRPPTTGACSAPGLQLFTDPIGDASDAATTAQHDITSISVAEPLDNATTGAASKIYFTIKVATLNQPILPGWRWSIRFTVNGFNPPPYQAPAPINQSIAQEDWHVSMDTSDGAAPVFTYGTTGVWQGAARFFVTLGNLDPASNVQPDGTITLVLPKSVFPGIQPGAAVNIALASVRATAPSIVPGTGGTNETIPDTTQPGTYVLRPANLCLPNVAPLAALSANPTTGLQPLAVNFNGSASHDSDAIDTIMTYTFNFGDGGDDVVQGTPTISHTFQNAGLYDVKLVVTDSRGKVSDNTAHQLIEVQQPLGAAKVVSRKTHGTAGAFDVDLPLSGTAGIECRAAGTNNSYTLVYTFNKNVTVPGIATVTGGTATRGTATIGPDPNQVTVPLTGVTVPNQHVVVSLSGVQGGLNEVVNNQVARLDVLVGDIDASRRVDSTDVFRVRQQSLQNANANNFRADVDGSGRIDSTDVFITRQHSLTALP